MAYCVNCGVELQKGIKKCPLCNTEIINPAEPHPSPEERRSKIPHEPFEETFDRSLWIKLVSIILAAPALISVTIDGIFGNNLDWSLYVTISLAIVWVWSITPFIFRKKIITRWVLFDALAFFGFLYLIEKISGTEGWFIPLALPIAVSFFVLVIFIIVLIDKKTIKDLQIPAVLLLSTGIFCVLVNGIISHHVLQVIKLDWSLLVMISCSAFAGIGFVLQQRPWVVEEIKNWFRV